MSKKKPIKSTVEIYQKVSEDFQQDMKKDYVKADEDWHKAIQEADAIFIKKREELWNKLSPSDRLELFCHVVSKLTKAELHDRISYRGVLYEEFGFGPESYVAAQLSGFLELHNSIYPDGLKTMKVMQEGLSLYGFEATEEEIQAKFDAKHNIIRKTVKLSS